MCKTSCSARSSPNEARKSRSRSPRSSVVYVLNALKAGVRVLPSENQKPPSTISLVISPWASKSIWYTKRTENDKGECIAKKEFKDPPQGHQKASLITISRIPLYRKRASLMTGEGCLPWNNKNLHWRCQHRHLRLNPSNPSSDTKEGWCSEGSR